MSELTFSLPNSKFTKMLRCAFSSLSGVAPDVEDSNHDVCSHAAAPPAKLPNTLPGPQLHSRKRS